MDKKLPRKICYLTGTRADYGLMQNVLAAINSTDDLSLEIIVTGQHLEQGFGYTASEVLADNYLTRLLEPVGMEGTDGLNMALGVASQMEHISNALYEMKPDLLLLLGDRGEMLAGAMAALYLGIPVGHFHGGERSGTVDDLMRRAISNLSHYHFPATEKAKQNLVNSGEVEKSIYLLGAPGLDSIATFRAMDRKALTASLGLLGDREIATIVFHPVVQDAAQSAVQAASLISALMDFDMDVVVMKPNSDAGSLEILKYYQDIEGKIAKGEFTPKARFHFVTHLERNEYLSLIAHSAVLIGNSSSGIIETASLRTPSVNIGDRQQSR